MEDSPVIDDPFVEMNVIPTGINNALESTFCWPKMVNYSPNEDNWCIKYFFAFDVMSPTV